MRFWLYLPVHILAWLLAWPLVPLAVALCDGEGRLPWLFRWLETHDALGWKGPLTEPATRATTERWGRRIGLIRWLWRNKAYTLRYWMRARITPDMARIERGALTDRRWGAGQWYGRIGPYWEWQPYVAFGIGKLYLRVGWKMRAFFTNPQTTNLAAGIFQGITPRTDDWDG